MLEINVYLGDKLIQKTTLSKNRVTVGRSETNDIVLHDRQVSRLHVSITKRDHQYLIEDLSTNGTFLNSARVKGALPIADECTVDVHPFTLKCTAVPDEITLPLIEPDRSPPRIEPYTVGAENSSQKLWFGLLVGEDSTMQKVYQIVQRVADSPAAVLIRGESGTGKELVAKAIHSLSARRNSPFVAIDCAAIPDGLVESEFFGFEKGAFTGASSSKKGWFEEAHGGTLFLDEVGELSASTQSKLLRFLQDKTFTRLGGTRTLQTDIRLITATNRDLEEAIQSNRFRSDLYFRLRVVQISLPSLCERSGDIPLLADHILSRIAAQHKPSKLPTLTSQAISTLKAYPWPGNVRQLENVLWNAFINTKPPHQIDVSDLELEAESPGSIRSFDEINRQLLLETLKGCQWNTAKAASILKVSRGTIYYKCKKLGIDIKQVSR